MIVKLGMLIVFFGVMVGIGLYCRRHATDVNGFVLGGRSVGPWLTRFRLRHFLFLRRSLRGLRWTVWMEVRHCGHLGGIGNALLGSLLAWAVLGRRTRIMTQHLSSATMPEFFGKRFGSDKLKIAASVIIFIFLIPTPPRCTTDCPACSAWPLTSTIPCVSSSWRSSPGCMSSPAATWPPPSTTLSRVSS